MEPDPGGSVQTCALEKLPRLEFLEPLYGGSLPAFSFLGGLLVVLAPPQLPEYPSLLALALEAAQGCVEVLTLSDTNAGHGVLAPRKNKPARAGTESANAMP